MDYEDYPGWDDETRRDDSYEQEVRRRLVDFFHDNQKKVFFSRQLEVKFENDYFHWVTNRAIRALIIDGLIKQETRKIKSAGEIHLLWHPSFRY